MPVEVRMLIWDELNEEHIADHGVTVREVYQVVENPHVVVKNRKRRRGKYLMIGRTRGGRVLTVALANTRTVDTWRPVTAYEATDAQKRVLERHAGAGEKE